MYGVDRVRCCLWLLMACLCTAAVAQNAPDIGFLYPAGGQRGTTFQVLVGGQYLKGATSATVSGTGVDVEVIRFVKAMSRKELNDLGQAMRARQREIMRSLGKDKNKAWQKLQEQEKMAGENMPELPMDLRELDVDKLSVPMLKALRDKLMDPKRQPNAQLDDRVLLSVTIAPDARTGARELRLLTNLGLSNPILLNVNSLPEHREIEPNEERALKVVSVPAILNGQIMPGDVDRFRFRAKRGQRLVADVKARALIPYLADAVPGWFQAVLALYDSEGRELAFVDDFRFDPDPVLRFEVPADGEYELLIRDSIYRGREDFVYRIAIGELPFVESSFPLGGRVGESTRVSLKGWNLPAKALTINGNGRHPGIRRVAVSALDAARPILFALDSPVEQSDREPNNLWQSAQPVTLPVTINGNFSRPGDWDVFQFKGRKGQGVSAEVFARRLNTPVDSVLKLTDTRGVELAVNDDENDPAAGLTTHHADSRLVATLPADGSYCLHIGDSQGGGGDAYTYRLRIREPRPDFKLRVTPSSINMYRGTTVGINVVAIRREGFEGDIELELLDAPEGVVLDGGRIPAGHDKVMATLTAPREMPEESTPIRIVGTAEVGGRQLRRNAVAAEDMMQAFLWRHLVPADKLMLTSIPRKWARPPAYLKTDEVTIPLSGESMVVRFRTGANYKPKDKIELELTDAPEGISISRVSTVAGGVDVTLMGDPEKLTPGLKGNLIMTAFTQRAIYQKGKPTGKKRRSPLGLVPAVPFTVAEK